MVQDMTKNYRLLRTIHHHDFYTAISENFQYYLGTLTQLYFEEIDSDIVSSGLNSFRNVESATEHFNISNFFYFVNGRFPTATAYLFITRADLSMEVNGEELNIKKLYQKFRTTNSHALVSSQFLAALNIFFGGNPELIRKFLTEFYQNMTVSMLSTDNAVTFDAFTDLSTSINLLLRTQRNEKISRIKVEDDETDLKLKTKYEFDDDPPPAHPFDTIQDNFNTEPENIDKEVKQVDIIELKLETPAKINENDNAKKFNNKLLDDFLVGIENTKQTLQELNDQAIEIDPVFIDDNDVFFKDELTDENKAFIKTVLDKANYTDTLGDQDDRQKLIQGDLSVPIIQLQPTANVMPSTDENIYT